MENRERAVSEISSKYKMIYDYHTHTIFSHGKSTVEQNICEAIRKGLKAIAIADHGPGHIFYGIDKTSYKKFRENELDILRKKYSQIDIYWSVEANIVAGENNVLDINPEEYDDYDFIIAGYHYGVKRGYCMSNWLIDKGTASNKIRKTQEEKNTKMIIEAIKNTPIKILTHPGDKAVLDIVEVARACEKEDVLMEINSKHAHLSLDELKRIKNLDVKFIIGSDAHSFDKVGDYEYSLERAIEAGIDIDRIVNIRKR